MIQDLHREESRKDRVNQHQNDRLAALETENGELKLYLAVLVRLLISKEVFHKEEFHRLAEVIDTEDGMPDGQYEGDLA